MGLLDQKRLHAREEEDSKFSPEKVRNTRLNSPDWGGSGEGYFGNQGTGQRTIIEAVARSLSTTRWRTNVPIFGYISVSFVWAFPRHVMDRQYCSLQLHNHSVQQM